MSALLELAERLEQSERGSRDLDADIYEVLGFAVKRIAIFSDNGWKGQRLGRSWAFLRDSRWEAMQRLTASLDAAMTLVPAGDRRWELTTEASASDSRFGAYQARVHIDEVCDDPDDSGPQGIANGVSPALALCAAALRARASVDTHPKDGDALAAPLVSGAVGDSRDAQPLPGSSS